MHDNYYAEYTPAVRMNPVPRLIPTELISFKGIFNN
jgi:hypothetical protein